MRTWPGARTTTPSRRAEDHHVRLGHARVPGLGQLRSRHRSAPLPTPTAAPRVTRSNVPDWWSTTAPSGGAVAVNSAYQNRANNTLRPHRRYILDPITSRRARRRLGDLPPGGALTTGTRGDPTSSRWRPAGPAPLRRSVRCTPAPVPGTVQAENYDTGGQAQRTTSRRSTGTPKLPRRRRRPRDDDGHRRWLRPRLDATGQWFKYTVNVATAGTHTVSFRVAAPSAVTMRPPVQLLGCET